MNDEDHKGLKGLHPVIDEHIEAGAMQAPTDRVDDFEVNQFMVDMKFKWADGREIWYNDGDLNMWFYQPQARELYRRSKSRDQQIALAAQQETELNEAKLHLRTATFLRSDGKNLDDFIKSAEQYLDVLKQAQEKL